MTRILLLFIIAVALATCCPIQTALSPLYYLYGRQMFDGKLIEYTVREVTQ